MEDLNVVDTINNVSNWLTNNQTSLLRYSMNIISSLIIIFLGIMATRMIPYIANNFMKSKNIDITIADFLSEIIRYSIVIVTFISVLGCIGVQTTSVIAVIGAAGLAIGLALQGSLSNFAAGVLLVSFRYFRAGDYVDFGGTAGTVMVIQIFATKLRTLDGKIVIVPNNKILSGNITNFSEEPNRLIDTIISVSYDSDIELVKKVIINILATDSRVLKDKGITVRLKSLGEISLNFMVRAWVSSGELQSTTFDLLEKIRKVFHQNKIDTPHRKIDIYFHPDKQTKISDCDTKNL